MLLSTIPLKGTKPADLGGQLSAYATQHAPGCAASVGESARALQKVRERLAAIESLTVTTGDAVAAELVKYHAQLVQLEARFDARGAELGVKFPWRNAWRPKEKTLHEDLSWERVGVGLSAWP